MFWRIQSFPPCRYHVFLSHAREDHDSLVRPVYDALTGGSVVPWLDREDYYYGRDSRTALRDGILRSRHVVFFVTPAVLASGRGWCAFELAYAEVMQSSFVTAGGMLANVVLPLFFLPQDDPALPRSVWQATRDRGRFYDAGSADPVTWAYTEITRFLRDEQQLADEVLAVAGRDKIFRKQLLTTPGLWERVAQFDPASLE